MIKASAMIDGRGVTSAPVMDLLPGFDEDISNLETDWVAVTQPLSPPFKNVEIIYHV